MLHFCQTLQIVTRMRYMLWHFLIESKNSMDRLRELEWIVDHT